MDEEEPREPPRDEVRRRRALEEARRPGRKSMAAEVARIQAEECAKEEASRKEREELERAVLEERNAQAAREQEERARVREQQAREEAARKARAEREEAARRAHAAREEIKRRAKEEREEAERNARKARLEERRAEEAQVTVQQMVLGSALVTCGAGVDIRSIITGFDLLRVVVKGLPHNTNFNEVAAAFTLSGVNPENVILQETRPNGGLADAIFLMKADQFESFAFGSDHTIDFQGRSFLLEVGPISSEDSMTLSSHSTNTLTVYWPVPSTSMIATYPTLEVAKAKAKELDAKMLRGQRVKAFMNTPPRTPHSWREFNPASVKLMYLPLDVPLTEVEVFSGTSLLRVLSSPTYIPEEFIEFLRKHLEGFPGVNQGTFVCLPSRAPNPTSRVEIQFHGWEEARFACDTLNNHRLRNDFPYVRTLLPRAHRYFANISHEQYRSQKNRWDSLVQEKGRGMARVQVHDRSGGRVVITVEGNDRKAVGALKVRVESLLAGERLDPSHWGRFFLSGTGFESLQDIHAESGAYVRIDKKFPALRVYGTAEAVVRAKESIRYSVIGTRSTSIDRVIPLKQRSVQYFVRRGLASLKEIIGEDNVSLDLTSTPRKLTIKVGEDAHHHLQRAMDESLEDFSLDEGHRDICPICCDTTSHPETLGCGHSYCTSCLWHYLESAANAKKFPLNCMGNNTSCRSPLPIPLIKRFLTVQRFNQLVEVAFLSYLDQHPRELKYCSTPDCNQIYRRDPTKPFLQCPACFSTICSSCQEESHEGMTCLQFKCYGLTAGQEWFTDDWASARGIKKCPGCGIWIEKTEGSCNHLTCKCGDHVCWKCMGIFTPETIHAHMHNVHGEIHDEPQRVLEERKNAKLLAAQQAEREQQERERQRQAALHDDIFDEPPQRVLQDQMNAQLLAAQQAEREQQERERQRQAAVLQQREIQRLRALEQAQAQEAANRQRLYAEAQRRGEEARRQEEVHRREERQREERMREARAARGRELQRQQLERQREQEEARRTSEGGGCCGLTISGVLAAIEGLFYKEL
jgi:hypothetical protein